jgi:pentose-5-phosphate-3-epimerase
LDADKRRLLRFLNYLKATDIEVGLLLNFGTKPEVKRKAFDNYRK